MTALRLLLVEDDVEFIQQYKDVLKDYNETPGKQIEMCICKSLSEAKDKLDYSIDAAVVDLNLGNDTTDGGKIIDEIKEHFRVPVAVFTGTPDDADHDPPVIGVFTKGEHGFAEVLDCLWDPYNIGLTHIMGGRGLLEERLNAVFLDNLLPTLDEWIRYGQDDRERTKKALLRFTLGHLVASLDGDEVPCYPEEVYLSPPLDNKLITGTLVQRKADKSRHVVMTPACDLVLRNGELKANSVQLAEIVSEDEVHATLKGNSNQKKKIKQQLKKNNYRPCFHWLPRAYGRPSGFLDFREIQTVRMDDFDWEYVRLDTRIAPGFVKDIVSRYAAFYARQGQPEIKTPTAR